ncbi:MAG: cyclic pyranopterin monophosphate synthase MoaC, partial [Firmicutes bacterium]|nr:cyclic pyranopterin monophosphate synthase MoaC [Bacillota bacterium]
MIDVGEKTPTRREAVARGEVRMRPSTVAAIVEGRVPKGPVLHVAQVAGIMAAKATPRIVPLCHPLPLEAVEVELYPGESSVEVEARV